MVRLVPVSKHILYFVALCYLLFEVLFRRSNFCLDVLVSTFWDFVEFGFIKANKTSFILKIMCILPSFKSEDLTINRIQRKKASKQTENVELIVSKQLLLESSI